MSVTDRWHRRRPKPGDEPCKCARGKNRLYPSAEHMQGDRWQVRWYDLEGNQRSRNFALKEGKNPDLHADAFDARIAAELNTGTYTDPSAGEVTLKSYAEGWRKNRTRLDGNEAAALEGRLRLHVYEDKPGSGLTPRGGKAIGQRIMRDLARRPSLIQEWIASMPLKGGSALMVVQDVSAVFRAAVDDGAAVRNPVRAGSVDWPQKGKTQARPWTRRHLDTMEGNLPARLKIVPSLGAGTGMRQGELFGLGAEDIDWDDNDPRIHVTRQVKEVKGRQYFAPVKNRKKHSVPLAKSVACRLGEYLAQYPPVPVTLEWYDPADGRLHGTPVTVNLVLHTRNGVWSRNRINHYWRFARRESGMEKPPPRGKRWTFSPGEGMHVLRHTAASSWLRAGIDVVRVAAWLGDTPAVVLATYAHLMPDRNDDDGRAAIDMMLG